MLEIPLPEMIKVGGFNYTIKVDAENDTLLTDNDSWGEHSGRQRVLRILSTAPEQQFSKTFIHEVLHAIDMVYQSNKLNDEEVSAISNGLLQVLEELGIRFVKVIKCV